MPASPVLILEAVRGCGPLAGHQDDQERTHVAQRLSLPSRARDDGVDPKRRRGIDPNVVLFEVKVGRDTVKPHQARFHEAFTKRGGLSLVVRSLADLEAGLPC